MNISYYIMYIVVEKYFPCRVLNFIRHTVRDISTAHSADNFWVERNPQEHVT